jgi:xylose isomerase
LAERYSGWNGEEARSMLTGSIGLEEIAHRVETKGINPQPRSGRQEYLESILNRYV